MQTCLLSCLEWFQPTLSPVYYIGEMHLIKWTSLVMGSLLWRARRARSAALRGSLKLKPGLVTRLKMGVSESNGEITAHRMLVAFRLSPPEQLIFLMQNRRNIMRTALPRRQ